MTVKKESLLLIAGIVWLIAGINVVLIGVDALLGFDGWKLAALMLGALVIFTLFHVRIFTPMAKRNEARILQYGSEGANPLAFLDKRGWIIMGFMMLLGFGGRALGLFPDVFVAFFYPGLGFALAVTGFGFLLRYFGKDWDFCKPTKSSQMG